MSYDILDHFDGIVECIYFPDGYDEPMQSCFVVSEEDLEQDFCNIWIDTNNDEYKHEIADTDLLMVCDRPYLIV